ncbi:MAG: hypothetical protein EOO67_19435 [Microbacterium sp.]|nr:MAG: hypothetical protein EOO67_19435 [Microbacterium sp.]
MFAPDLDDVCGAGNGLCSEYTRQLGDAGVAQTHAIFAGASVCALIAAVLALALFRGAATRGSTTPVLGWGA